MSLIICSECGKEISDKALACIHCGCPIQKEKKLNTTKNFVYMCMSNTCLSNPFKEFDEYKGSTIICPDCGRQLEYYETEIIDNNTDLVVEQFEEKSHKNIKNAHQANVPTCPTCQSTNIEKISLTKKAIGGAMFGILSSDVRKTMHCRNCGYKW